MNGGTGDVDGSVAEHLGSGATDNVAECGGGFTDAERLFRRRHGTGTGGDHEARPACHSSRLGKIPAADLLSGQHLAGDVAPPSGDSPDGRCRAGQLGRCAQPADAPRGLGTRNELACSGCGKHRENFLGDGEPNHQAPSRAQELRFPLPYLVGEARRPLLETLGVLKGVHEVAAVCQRGDLCLEVLRQLLPLGHVLWVQVIDIR